MLLIDFQDSNFENLFQTDPEYLSETLYRDIKVSLAFYFSTSKKNIQI